MRWTHGCLTRAARNFVEPRHGKVRRISLPRTLVNKEREGPEGPRRRTKLACYAASRSCCDVT